MATADREAAQRPQKAIRIVVVEPHEIVRKGLIALLNSSGAVEVVAEAANGNKAFEAACNSSPNVVVTELNLPDGRGLDTIRRIAALRPSPHIVVLSVYRFKDEVTAAFEAGASACVSKSGGGENLIRGIYAVASGKLHMCPLVTDLILRAYSSPEGPSGIREGAIKALTNREREVLDLISNGRTDREVAKALNLSIKTIHAHRTSIMAKLGVRNATMLIRRAIQLGIVNL